MSTPVFCSIEEIKGSVKEALQTRGYVIVAGYSHRKHKYRFCFSEEEVEAERIAAQQMYKHLGKYGYNKLYYGYLPEVPYLPPTCKRASTNGAEEFLVIRYLAIRYGHDGRPMPEDWYPSGSDLKEWRASLTNADVTVRWLSQGQYGLGYNRDYGIFILAKEHGEWVWPNRAQLNLAYQSIVEADIPEENAVIHIKPANTRGSVLTKKKAMEKLFPEARIIEEKWDNAYNCAFSAANGDDDSVDLRREVARTILNGNKTRSNVRAMDPLGYGWEHEVRIAADFLFHNKPFDKYPFEEVLLWMHTFVDRGYPVIFKGEAARYIIENMVTYIQRPQGETGVFDLRADKLADGISILTRTDEGADVRAEVTVGPDCVALSFEVISAVLASTAERKGRLFDRFVKDVLTAKEPVIYFVAGSDNKTRRSLVEGRELLATSLTPADILYLARQRGVNMPAMVVEKALPGQRGLLVRTNITK